MNYQDIRITKPRPDCVFCELHHFIDSYTGEHVDSQYAICRNPVKSHGMTFIDITADGNSFFCEVTCRNCKEFKSSFQLSILFD